MASWKDQVGRPCQQVHSAPPASCFLRRSPLLLCLTSVLRLALAVPVFVRTTKAIPAGQDVRSQSKEKCNDVLSIYGNSTQVVEAGCALFPPGWRRRAGCQSSDETPLSVIDPA